MFQRAEEPLTAGPLSRCLRPAQCPRRLRQATSRWPPLGVTFGVQKTKQRLPSFPLTWQLTGGSKGNSSSRYLPTGAMLVGGRVHISFGLPFWDNHKLWVTYNSYPYGFSHLYLATQRELCHLLLPRCRPFSERGLCSAGFIHRPDPLDLLDIGSSIQAFKKSGCLLLEGPRKVANEAACLCSGRGDWLSFSRGDDQKADHNST